MKKILAMLLAVMMVLSLLSACSNTPDPTAPPVSDEIKPTSAPEVSADDDKVDFVNAPDLSGQTVRLFSGEITSAEGGYPSILPRFQQVEELTGVKIEWEAPVADYESILQTRLVGDPAVAPDVIGNGDYKTPVNMIEDGLAVAISDYFDIAPNMAAWYEANPEYAKQVTYTDGKIYTIPTLTYTDCSVEGYAEYYKVRGDEVYWYRGDIAEELGFTEVPKTLEELEAMLYAVKAAYPDMMPMATANILGGNATGARNFSASYGLHFNGQNADNLYYPDENGVVQMELLTDAGIAWMEKMTQWYADGIIVETGDFDIFYASGANGTAFAGMDTTAHERTEVLKELDPDAYFVYMPYVPAEGYEVAYTMRDLYMLSACVINNGDEDRIEAAIKFLDFVVFSDYGIYSNQAGVMGVGWDFGENGEFVPNLDFVRSVVNGEVALRNTGADTDYNFPSVYDAEVCTAWYNAIDAVYAENGKDRFGVDVTKQSYADTLAENLSHAEQAFPEFYAEEADQEILNKYSYEAYKYAALYSGAVIRGEQDIANIQEELIDPLYNELHLQEVLDVYNKYVGDFFE